MSENVGNDKAKEAVKEMVNRRGEGAKDGVVTSAFARMVAKYYVAMGFIDEYEREDFIKALCRPPKNRIVAFINDVIVGFFDSIAGALFAPLAVKLSQRWANSLDYATEKDEAIAEIKRRMYAEMVDAA